MPVKIIGDRTPPKRRGRGLGFDRRVIALAPMIQTLRSEGLHAIHQIMKRLNDAGVSAPNGRGFTFGTTHRVVRRLQQLRLGDGPRSVSDALKTRAGRPRGLRRAAPSLELLAEEARRATEPGLAGQHGDAAPAGQARQNYT
jgi:hypothetical protein